MNLKRISAYTLHELIVTMILSGILLIMVYYSLNVVTKYYRHYKVRQEQLEQIKRLQFLLQKDCRKAIFVVDSFQHILCRYNNGLVEYEVSDQWIIRKQVTLVDTFYCNTLNKTTSLLGRAQECQQNCLIDRIRLELMVAEDRVFLQASKSYAADQLILWNDQNGNE